MEDNIREEDNFSENYLKELGLQNSNNYNDFNYNSLPINEYFNLPSEQNLIEWQLDFSRDLEEIKRYLSGYREGYNERGERDWIPPSSEEEIPFNEFGVNVIMGHVRAYLNRNTVLSNYSEKRIKKILYDLGNQLGDEIEQTYEKLGMDTPYKQRRFKLIVMNILHMVESAYNRALSGGERESLRTARQVTQTEPLGNLSQRGYGYQNKNKSKWYKPSTWI